MTCKDCIHCEACERMISDTSKMFKVLLSEILKMNCDIKYDSTNILSGAEICQCFQDRSRFVELPCVAGEYVYVIEPIFGKSIEHTISRRKIKSIEPHAEIKFYGGWIHDCLSGFGRYIFSTYEAAEQALKERIENDA